MINNKITVLLCGLAGSGKGTQSELIKKKFGLLHIAPGDLIRAGIADGTLGDDIAQTIKQGNLISAEQVVGMVLREVASRAGAFDGILFDGFPRNEEQDDALRLHVSAGDFIDVAILLDVKEEALLLRLSSRLYCDNCSAMYDANDPKSLVNGEKVCQNCGGKTFHRRDDDSDAAAIKKRFDIFRSETMKVVDRYGREGRLHVVNGDKDVSSVSVDIDKILGAYFG